MTLLVGCGSYANANTGQASFEVGYRRDTLDWKQKFPSSDPVATSSVKFKDLDIFQIGLHGRSTIGGNFYVRGNAYWGWILDGDYKNNVNAYFSPESYFCEDNFRFGFSDERCSTIDDKYVYGIGAAIGYPFYFCDCTIILAPVIGYAFDGQNVEIDDRGFRNNRFFGNCDCDTNQCCEKNFISRWYGPFVGVDFDYRPWNSCLNLWAELEYHWGSFRGRSSNCDDNNFFDHSRRSHDADGFVFAAGVDYDLNECWTVGLSVKIQDWEADKKRHHDDFDSYGPFCGCDSDSRIKTEHSWTSYAINLTFGRDF